MPRPAYKRPAGEAAGALPCLPCPVYLALSTLGASPRMPFDLAMSAGAFVAIAASAYVTFTIVSFAEMKRVR